MVTTFWRLRRIVGLWIKKPGLMTRLHKADSNRKEQSRLIAKRIRAQELRSLCRKNFRTKAVLPPYLEKNRWEEELNYKMWITKGARFQAAKRCEEKDHSATWTNALLSSYLIIIGLIPFIPHAAFKGISPDIIGFATTGVSIILLAYGLIVAMREYPVQAVTYHDCALEIGVLYNAFRRAKELEDNTQKIAEITRISLEYDDLLSRYPNHHSLDSKIFETSKRAYFKLNIYQCIWRHFLYWLHTKALHHLTVSIPFIAGALIWFR